MSSINSSPVIRKTGSSNMYIKMHSEILNNISQGTQYYDNIFSILIMEIKDTDEYYMREILYLPLENAYQKYIIDNDQTYPEPYQLLPVLFLDILKIRLVSRMEQKIKNYNYNIKDCFNKFCEIGEEKCSRDELVFLENKLHFDDELLTDWIVPSEFDLRNRAIRLITESEKGSWLVRRSSIKEQQNIIIRVVTFKSNSSIDHYLFSHMSGLGYVSVKGSSGDIMPKIGEDKTISILKVYSSLPSLLKDMENNGLVLKNIVVV